jgi:CHRD domain
MRTKMQIGAWSGAVLTGALAILAGCQSPSMSSSMEQRVELSGSNEVPAVTTAARGIAVITVMPDRSVRAEVTVSGMTPTASHIHEAAAGANGPVIVPFTKSDTDTNVFVAPAGAKLTEAQYASYKAGNLYVNVHSAKNPGGEVRGQLKGN